MKPQPFTILQQFMVGEIKIDTKAQLDRTYLRLLIDAFVTSQEAMLAYLHSYVPANEYRGGHVAPVFNVVRRGSGIAVPSRYIEVAQTQPLR